jgi:hypothetical protein
MPAAPRLARRGVPVALGIYPDTPDGGYGGRLNAQPQAGGRMAVSDKTAAGSGEGMPGAARVPDYVGKC